MDSQHVTLTKDQLEEKCNLFINQLKTEREKQGISTASLSQMTGIKQPNITRMEIGGSKPGLAMIIKITFALGCDLSLKKGITKPKE
jgi:transcriptional regulator with XRE-family HTH domain